MCRVETYGVVYPDGFIDRRQRIVHCKRGTRSSQCSNLEYDQDSYEERPATEDEKMARMEPWLPVIAPRPQSSGRSETTSEGSKSKEKLRRFFGLKPKSKPHEKPLEQRKSSPKEPLRKSKVDDSERPTTPRIIQRRPRQKVEVHNPDKESRARSSSPKLDHNTRLQHSPSPGRDPELDRARLREEERQKHKDKAAKKQAEARDRAIELHEEEEEQRLQDMAWARKEGKKRRDGRPRSYHAIHDDQPTDEQLRAQQRQRERDLERLRAFDRLAAQRQAEEDRRTQEETEERRARRHEDDEDRYAWRRQEDEARRRRRQGEAGVRRQPHHTPIIHDPRNYDPDDFEQQGTDFLHSAIAAAERREAERRAPPTSWRPPVRGSDGLVRRNTIDGSQGEERNGRRRRDFKRAGRSD